jgi:hypothetical protein
MDIYKINVDSDFDPECLKILFPKICVHCKPIPTSATMVYSVLPLNKEFYPECKILFLKSDDGISIDHTDGIFQFLEKINYFFGSTELEIKEQKEKFVLFFGNKINLPPKDIKEFFTRVFLFRIARFTSLDMDIKIKYLEYLSLPLPKRKEKILAFTDHKKSVKSILQLINDYYNDNRSEFPKTLIPFFDKAFQKFSYPRFKKTFQEKKNSYDTLIDILSYF